jgi:hypothetical protein
VEDILNCQDRLDGSTSVVSQARWSFALAVGRSAKASLGDGRVGRHGEAAVRALDRVRKTPLLGHLYIKCIILPRQARDKHRENSKKSGVFLRGADAVAGEYERLRERYTAATSP